MKVGKVKECRSPRSSPGAFFVGGGSWVVVRSDSANRSIHKVKLHARSSLPPVLADCLG